MKTIYRSIFVCLTLLLGFTACDKDEIPPTGPQDNAEKIAVGTYVGEWTRTNLSTEAVESGTGSITFSTEEEYGNNVSVMTLVSSVVELGVDSDTSVCNITRMASGELVYYNMVKANPFGMVFQGRISPEGVATMTYTKLVRSGRREVEFSYTFTGTKQ